MDLTYITGELDLHEGEKSPALCDEDGNLKVALVAGSQDLADAAADLAAATPGLVTAASDLSDAANALGAGSSYETVAASQTDQVMGTGAVGDRLDAVLIIPTSLSPGAVSIEDGSTNTEIFAGGTGSVSSLVPFLVPMGTNGIVSVSGGWEITTGANVRAVGFGRFT